MSLSYSRPSEIAIQPKIKARLRMAIRIYALEHRPPTPAFSGPPIVNNMTIEQLAEEILNDAIKERFPLVLEAEREIAAIEKRMMEKGKSKNDT